MRSTKAPIIALVLSGVALLVSIGLCGMGLTSHTGDRLSGIGIYLFFASLFGGAVSFIWLMVALSRRDR